MTADPTALRLILALSQGLPTLATATGNQQNLTIGQRWVSQIGHSLLVWGLGVGSGWDSHMGRFDCRISPLGSLAVKAAGMAGLATTVVVDWGLVR